MKENDTDIKNVIFTEVDRIVFTHFCSLSVEAFAVVDCGGIGEGDLLKQV